MTPEDWQRIKRIAGDAIERLAPERAAFIADACGPDAFLRQEVEALLVSMDAAEDLYETPTWSIDRAAALQGLCLRDAVTPGFLVGPYRIEREIGRGGMGSVHLAVRADGAFEQQVAIKVVGGLSTAEILDRFRTERQILAGLEHPNIARLLDGGSTPGGVPFLVMEYVDGMPIDEFCDAHKLGLSERLALFRQVAAAVHYAHQRLIIHRDIKAGNILVTADGTPKLLDFGIAKVLESPVLALHPTTLRPLTPESASPEQVRGEPITIASDVYALGVLLYRLVSGQSPYGSELLSQVALLNAICQLNPLPPIASRARAGLPPWQTGAFPQDLDSIVLMALRKEPERRYGSVAQCADDVERFTRGMPVRAAPDTSWYRARKFVVRHRLPVAIAAAALTAIVAGAGVAVYESTVAGRERARAEQRFNDLRRMANSFVFEFHDAIADLPGSLAARRLVVNRAAEYLDQLAAEAHDDVTLQRELAAANVRLANITGGGGTANLGDIPGAEVRYEKALTLLNALAARPEPSAEDVEALARLHVQMSRLSVLKGDLEAAEQRAQTAVELIRRAPHGLVNTATPYQQLGFVQGRRGKPAEAVESLGQAMVEARRQLASDSDNPSVLARFSRIATDYGDQLARVGRYDEALSVLDESQFALDRALQREPLNAGHRLNLVYLLNLRGQALQSLERWPDASSVFAEALGAAEELRAASPDDYEARLTLNITRHWYAAASARAGDPAAARLALRAAVLDGDALVASAPANRFAASQVAAARIELGKALLHDDPESGEGCAILNAGLETSRKLAAGGQLLEISDNERDVLDKLAFKCKGAGR